MESSASGVTSSEKEFIEFLTAYIVDNNTDELNANLKDITSHIQEKYPPKHNLNLFRK